MSEHEYEGMTNQDVDPVDVFEEMREAEYRLDAEQEAAQAEREKQDQAAEAGGDPDDCDPEFIDGSWSGCGKCEACADTAEAGELDESYPDTWQAGVPF